MGKTYSGVHILLQKFKSSRYARPLRILRDRLVSAGLLAPPLGRTEMSSRPPIVHTYDDYVALTALQPEQIARINQEMTNMKTRPLISLIMNVEGIDESDFHRTMTSICLQLYTEWDVIVVCRHADCVNDYYQMVCSHLDAYCLPHSKAKAIFNDNQHRYDVDKLLTSIQGEFFGFINCGDQLAHHALFEVSSLINTCDRIPDMIYSDEDQIDADQVRYSPQFKPDWSPDTIMTCMYTGHLSVYRLETIRKIDGIERCICEWDMTLRLSEITDCILHIDKVLYHAVNPLFKYEFYNANEIDVLQAALVRRNIDADVELIDSDLFRVKYKLSMEPRISIIIPTKDASYLLDTCLKSIFLKSDYQNFEVIVVDNGSKEEATLELFQAWQSKEPTRFRYFTLDIPFNYSKLNNAAERIATGELILLLNNDMEVISPDWLRTMAGYAVQPHIGAVGAKLLYSDRTIQHAGVILGIGGVAAHGHHSVAHDSPGYGGCLQRATNYSAVTGACLMVKRQVYQEVGGLDEQLAVAFNDIDFCLKVKEQGYHNICLPFVTLYHYESQSRGQEDSPAKLLRFGQEIKRMQEKWGSLLQNDPCYNRNLTLERGDFSLKGVPPYVDTTP